jgi:hypothetical protein
MRPSVCPRRRVSRAAPLACAPLPALAAAAAALGLSSRRGGLVRCVWCPAQLIASTPGSSAGGALHFLLHCFYVRARLCWCGGAARAVLAGGQHHAVHARAPACVHFAAGPPRHRLHAAHTPPAGAMPFCFVALQQTILSPCFHTQYVSRKVCVCACERPWQPVPPRRVVCSPACWCSMPGGVAGCVLPQTQGMGAIDSQSNAANWSGGLVGCCDGTSACGRGCTIVQSTCAWCGRSVVHRCRGLGGRVRLLGVSRTCEVVA